MGTGEEVLLVGDLSVPDGDGVLTAELDSDNLGFLLSAFKALG